MDMVKMLAWMLLEEVYVESSYADHTVLIILQDYILALQDYY